MNYLNCCCGASAIPFSPADAVSFGYVCGDTADKAYKEYSEGKGLASAGKMGFDVLLWQSLASVAVPGLTINLAASISRDFSLPVVNHLGFCCLLLDLRVQVWKIYGDYINYTQQPGMLT